MSIVILGGHDRMAAQYKKLCRSYHCKVKVFTQMEAGLGRQVGCPDLLVLFTSTVSHKMVKTVLDRIDCSRTDVVRCRCSSQNALMGILEECCGKEREEAKRKGKEI